MMVSAVCRRKALLLVAAVFLFINESAFSESSSKDLLGSFGVPGLSLNSMAGYDDNVLRNVEREGDYVFVNKLKLTLDDSAKKPVWNFNARVEDTRYAELHEETVQDYFCHFDRVDTLSSQVTLSSSLDYELDHIDREDPSTHRADHLARISRLTGGLSLVHSLAKFENEVSYHIKDLNYRGVSIDDSAINTDDEDRIEHEAGLTSTYHYSKHWSPKAKFTYSSGSYDTELDDNGFARDSDDYFLGLGSEFMINDSLSGEVLLGGLRSNLHDSAFEDVETLAWEAQVVWSATKVWQLVFESQRTFEETNVDGSSGYDQAAYIIEISRQLGGELKAVLEATYTDIDFKGVPIDLDDYALTPSMVYRINNSWSTSLEYGWKERQSNVAEVAFERHHVFLALIYQIL